jgi:tRNA threonylcarbamoyladenosine biosynthesis protein TsaB
VLDALRGESYTAQFTHEAGGVRQVSEVRIVPSEDVVSLADALGARAVGPDQRDPWLPHARGMALLGTLLDANGPIDVATWEPLYGRVAEAQAKWEAVHGRALPR